ncbi:MAG: hypothetical protein EHM45_04855 [Desulfobacteraceae bacterium]|nr:MAG: hypothetical protein EHM45_04855 [Desulfobacteraceae bacterium]
MNHSIFLAALLVFLVLHPGNAFSQTDPCPFAVPKPVDANRIPELTREFKRLRNIPGHFQGGDWNTEVDSWMGLKHRVMSDLGFYAEHNRISVGELRELMGEPDRILYIGGPPWDPITSWSAAHFSLIYEWRGDHDYLVFDCRTGMVTSSHWFYAGDK